MKKIFYIILFIILIILNKNNMFCQNRMKDSLLILLKNTNQDTSRCNIISQLVEVTNDNEWPIYNIELEKLTKKNITLYPKTNPLRKYYLKYYANAINNKGLLSREIGNISKAFEHYFESLKIREEIKDKYGISESFYNIGLIYADQEEFSQALNYFENTLKIRREIGNKKGVINVLASIGRIYKNKNDLNTAFKYYDSCLNISKEIRYINGISIALNNISKIYEQQGNISKAIEYSDKSLTLSENIEDKKGVTISLNNLSSLYLDLHLYNKAIYYAEKSMKISKEMGYANNIRNAALQLYYIYITQGVYKKALENHLLYITMRDSIDNIANAKASLKSQMQHEYETKAIADSIKVIAEKKVSQAKLAESNSKLKQEKSQRFTLYGGLILVLIFAGFMLNRFVITKKQKEVIEDQKHIVDEKQKEIIESITYAKRLQEAILPPQAFINKYIPNNFILYKPKDLVAGDFYWAEKNNDLFFIAAADSTGHGVPGCMVSVVCSNALNRTIKEFNLTETGKILDKTRELVLETFEKSTNEVKDGMDISLLCIDNKNKQIFWSGANNALWYVQNNELYEIKADKQPIGKTEYPKPFITHQIEYKSNTTFYLFTDGFADQFGGPKGKKFKYKQFSDLLVNNINLTQQLQAETINKAFEDWKGNLEQVDDVCVIGIKI